MSVKLKKLVEQFKQDLIKKIEDGCKTPELIAYIREYDTDVAKNSVCPPLINRCNALAFNGTRCSRKRRNNSEFCGMHLNQTPDKVFVDENPNKEIFVTTIEIKGIVYYIDKVGNVYDTGDVIEGMINPKVITTYTFVDGQYHIPTLGI